MYVVDPFAEQIAPLLSSESAQKIVDFHDDVFRVGENDALLHTRDHCGKFGVFPLRENFGGAGFILCPFSLGALADDLGEIFVFCLVGLFGGNSRGVSADVGHNQAGQKRGERKPAD